MALDLQCLCCGPYIPLTNASFRTRLSIPRYVDVTQGALFVGIVPGHSTLRVQYYKEYNVM